MLFKFNVLQLFYRRVVVGRQQVHRPSKAKVTFFFPIVYILLGFVRVPLIHFLNEIVKVLCFGGQVVLEQLLEIKFIRLLRYQLNLILVHNSLFYLLVQFLCLLTIHTVNSGRIIGCLCVHGSCLHDVESIFSKHETHFAVLVGLLTDEDFFLMRYGLFYLFGETRLLIDTSGPLFDNTRWNVHIYAVFFGIFSHLLNLSAMLLG